MILHSSMPYDAFTKPRLPGVAPLDPATWLLVDEAHAGQMAERDRLLAACRPDVLQLDPAARLAAEELLEVVLAALPEGYARADDKVVRPDGQRVLVKDGDPLGTVGRLVQEDMCILQKRGHEHVLTGAVLCFPASWRLDEKFLCPLTDIHVPVASYDENIALRVQRLFDGVRVGRPLWRFNALWYADAALHQPRSMQNRRAERGAAQAGYLRSERQCILRLPRTDAIVFSIHTYVLTREDALRSAEAWSSERKL